MRGKKAPKEYQGYNHYRTLLYVCIQEAFLDYLKEKWQCLREPKWQGSEISEEVFCTDKVKIKNTKPELQQVVGIYHDGQNIIPNRNVIHANMYGNIKVLKNCVKNKVKKSNIQSMYQAGFELQNVLREGVCRNVDDQKKLREFQNLRNHVELVNLSIYSEILNDMQGQLINWSYMRERDLMYYQLGYYYTKLYWTDSIPENDPRRTLAGEDFRIVNGAVLYEILAMNSYTLPLIGYKNGSAVIIPGESNIGNAVGIFLNEYEAGSAVYSEGLDLFENTDEHKDIITTRNYIDHFKYFMKADRSMMELYSEVYDRFFRHDLKMKKSVSFVMTNIMAENFMTMKTRMEAGEKRVNGKCHQATSIVIDDGGIKSTLLTYYIVENKDKPKEKTEVQVNARSDIFLEQWKDILEYKQVEKAGQSQKRKAKEESFDSMIGEQEDFKEIRKTAKFKKR